MYIITSLCFFFVLDLLNVPGSSTNSEVKKEMPKDTFRRAGNKAKNVQKLTKKEKKGYFREQHNIKDFVNMSC